MKKIGLGLIVLVVLLAASCASLGSIKNGTLVIKDGVTKIPDAKNKTKTKGEGRTIVIGTTGKYENKMLTSVVFPSSLTKIGSGAFKANNLTSITIPDGVTSIGKEAFYNNQLTSVAIPDSVVSIGEFAFQRNLLTSITVHGNVSWLENNWNNEDTEVGDYLASIGIVAIDSSAFGSGFADAYNANGRQAGTYTRPDTKSTTWTRE